MKADMLVLNLPHNQPYKGHDWQLQSTFVLRTPRYTGHLDKTDSSQIPGENKLPSPLF